MKRLAALAAAITLLTLAAPAGANISADHWDRTTVVIQTMKAGTSAEMTWQHDRINNLRAAMSSTMSIVEGGCQPNMPCVEVQDVLAECDEISWRNDRGDEIIQADSIRSVIAAALGGAE